MLLRLRRGNRRAYAGGAVSNSDDTVCAGYGSSPFREMSAVKPLYWLPDDPLANEVLIPSFSAATAVNSMAGFFSSEALASLAPGLATFINCSEGVFRLVVSPLLRADDKEAIERGLQSTDAVLLDVFEPFVVTEDLIAQHTLHCLSWLLRKGRIEIKVALMKNALFHPKVWLFQTAGDTVAVHGSSNITYPGIHQNIEQVAVSKSWADLNQKHIVESLENQFHSLWNDDQRNCIVVPMPEAVRHRLLSTYRSNTPPSEGDLKELYRRATEVGGVRDASVDLVNLEPERFEIPGYLRYEDGPFAHQGAAVRAWCDAGHQGVLEMATGSGKTIAAMICAKRLSEGNKPLLIVVAAPYVPLIQQWCDEIEPFGIRPTNLTAAGGPSGRARELGRIGRRLRLGSADVAAVVVSHRTLADSEFRSELRKLRCLKLLIADEVHNLGSEGFISDTPDFFDFRLGLSATPERQYDQRGTEALFDFIGPVVFRFTLEEAIGKCLVPYDYHVHPVDLTLEEMDRWHEITEKIKANAWRQEGGEPDEYLAKLFRDRRAILETAENKLPALQATLGAGSGRELRHALIYATDKAPRQLEAVNALMNRQGILFHQLTYEETAHRHRVASILKEFQDGQLQVLTAKRVLDEGVNIPQVREAFILASTTVERQWVQRRGRLLRKCDEIGKTHSVIHDFVVLPPGMSDGDSVSPDPSDSDARSVAVSELRRVRQFASLARNAGRPDGPLHTIDLLMNVAFT